MNETTELKENIKIEAEQTFRAKEKPFISPKGE